MTEKLKTSCIQSQAPSPYEKAQFCIAFDGVGVALEQRKNGRGRGGAGAILCTETHKTYLVALSSHILRHYSYSE